MLLDDDLDAADHGDLLLAADDTTLEIPQLARVREPLEVAVAALAQRAR